MQMKSIANSAVIYCRISKNAEGDELGVKRQLADCMALADRLDLTVVDTYIDNDTGASDRTNKKAIRHEYMRMLADGREGKYAHLIAHSASRLTRRPRELEQLVDFNKETSIALRMYDTDSVDLSTANGLKTARIMAAVDAAESDRISERQETPSGITPLQARLSFRTSECSVGTMTVGRSDPPRLHSYERACPRSCKGPLSPQPRGTGKSEVSVRRRTRAVSLFLF